MFFPKAMTEIELIVPAKDLLAVTKVLSTYGVFHQTDSNYPGVASGSANTWQENAASYAALERRIQIVMQGLSIDEGGPPSSEFDAMVEVEKIRPALEEIEGQVKAASDQLSGEKKRLEQLESILRQLEPVAEVDLDVSALRNSRYVHSTLGLIPAANVDRLQTSLARVPHVFLNLRSDADKAVVLLVGSQTNSDVLERAARSAYLNPLIVPEEYKGTPANIIQSLHQSIDEAQHSIADAKESLSKLAETHRQQLRDLSWQVHTSRVLSDAIVRYGQLKHTYVVTGWVPVDDLDGLTTRLRAASKEILIESLPTARYGENLNVPVALSTNKFLRPFQMLVNTYARPLYGELDPTLLMAITFPLLYGAMFGDLGQGLILLVLGLLIHNKIFAKGMQSLGLLIAYCGASAAVFGYLYGSIFGFEGQSIDTYLHFHFEPLWISPIENILSILSLAIDVGIVLLLFAFLLGIFNNIRSKDWAHLIFGHTGLVALAFYISFLALLGGFLGNTAIAPRVAVAISKLPLPFTAIALVFGILVMFSGFFRNLVEGHRPLVEGKGVGGFLMFFVQSFMDVFETVISMLSNTLSFVRVGAFAVAHGGLSLAIFSLAGTEPNVKFWIVILIGNIIIVGLEGLIVGIQTMRLHYYELFGKFFTGGGMRFEPLKVTPSNEEG
ncbi:MAG TPA: V-type ATPase 116kDa subunit family protein [Anaerolineales bacterium]